MNAIVIPSMAKNRARRFDAYGMDAEGRVLLQIDFNRLEGRSDLYSVRIYLDRGGESVYLTECSIRYWSSGEKHTEPAGPLVYHDPLSSAERVVSFEFSATPFANIATSAAFALLPAPLLDAVRPIAKTVLGR